MGWYKRSCKVMRILCAGSCFSIAVIESFCNVFMCIMLHTHVFPWSVPAGVSATSALRTSDRPTVRIVMAMLVSAHMRVVAVHLHELNKLKYSVVRIRDRMTAMICHEIRMTPSVMLYPGCSAGELLVSV